MAQVETQTGEIVQVIGPTVDIRFEDRLPDILNAIQIKNTNADELVTVEVAQHLGNNVVRCVSMSLTDGLVRGMKAVDTGHPISVPVGRETLGRMFNMFGIPIDGKGDFKAEKTASIHQKSPNMDDRESATKIFEIYLRLIPKAVKLDYSVVPELVKL